MEFYGQFPKLLRSLVDDVEDSESLADDDDVTSKRVSISKLLELCVVMVHQLFARAERLLFVTWYWLWGIRVL